MARRILAALAVAGALPLHAATFTVTTLADSGAGSLRDAVAQANANPGADTITFAPAVTGTINLTGTIGINDALTIQGPGPASLTVDGGGINRVFYIGDVNPASCPAPSGPLFEVTLSGMTIRNGIRNTDNTGGGVFTSKTLTLSNVVVRDSKARSGGGLSVNIHHPGQSLTVVDSAFIDNAATPLVPTFSQHAGGGIFAVEGCTRSHIEPVTISITRTVFTGNRVRPGGSSSGRGAGLYVAGRADVTITDSRIVANHSEYPETPVVGPTYQAGGLYARAKSVLILRSEISENSADTGSALFFTNDELGFQDAAGAVDVRIANSTISGNVAWQSATIYGHANVALDFLNSTIAGNSAASGRTAGIAFNNGYTQPGSEFVTRRPSLALTSTILWNPGDNFLDFSRSTANLPGLFTLTANQSIYGKLCTNCATVAVTGTGNLPGVDPALLPLAANGGLTRTHALQAASPAIGTGSNALGLATDQRGDGFPRQQGTVPDMGALEYVYPALCADLNDVPGDSAFCQNVAWLRNRAVTQGCGGGNFCSDDSVHRLQMAAFMNRLGTALSPTVLSVAQSPGLLDFAAAPIVCRTAVEDLPAATAPRRLTLDGTFSGLAGASSFGRMGFVVSTDGGTTWTAIGYSQPRQTFQANAWRHIRHFASYDLPAGTAARFAIRMDRASTTDPSGVLQSTCHLRARVDPGHDFSIF